MANNKVETLQKKISDTPSAGLFYLLSEEYMRLGLYDEAEILCKQGILRHPDYICAHILLGKIYMAKRLLKDAVKEFEAVIKLMPHNLYAYKKLTEIYAAIGDNDKALELYVKALSSGIDKQTPPRKSRVLLPKTINNTQILNKETKLKVQERAVSDFHISQKTPNPICNPVFPPNPQPAVRPSDNEDLFEFILESFADNGILADDDILTTFQDINDEIINHYDFGAINQSISVNIEENSKIKKLDNMLLRLKMRQQEISLC
jgi:tetratricopeptide (TPR) repeat protein